MLVAFQVAAVIPAIPLEECRVFADQGGDKVCGYAAAVELVQIVVPVFRNHEESRFRPYGVNEVAGVARRVPRQVEHMVRRSRIADHRLVA